MLRSLIVLIMLFSFSSFAKEDVENVKCLKPSLEVIKEDGSISCVPNLGPDCRKNQFYSFKINRCVNGISQYNLVPKLVKAGNNQFKQQSCPEDTENIGYGLNSMNDPSWVCRKLSTKEKLAKAREKSKADADYKSRADADEAHEIHILQEEREHAEGTKAVIEDNKGGG